ncbi:glycosyltransferase [Sphingomonas sp. MMS24-JH45]
MTLEIAGAGGAAAEAAVDALIADVPGRRAGFLAADALQPWMNGAAVFAMPSHRETFGTVFSEALLAGCPIVYPEGRAVAGYLDDCPFALAVPPRDHAAIGDAIAELVHDQHRRKAALARWHAEGGGERFRRASILRTYREGLAAVVGSD